jgi:hypothetical protein
MNQQYTIKGTPFLLWWMASAVLAWPLIMVLTMLVMYPLAMMLNATGIGSMMYSPASGPWLDVLYILLIGGLLGGIAGGGAAHLQRWLLQTRLYWVAENWRTWSVAGGVLGGIVVGLGTLAISPEAIEDGVILVAMPIFMTIVSAFQWLSLRHITDHAWLWVLANAVGGVVFAGLILMNRPPENSLNYSLAVLGLWLVATLVQGAITGFVMLHLFENHLLPMDTGHPDAPDKDDHEKSIWDKAI